MEDVINKILCCDVLEGLRRIPDGIATLVCTSPPYNTLSKGYDNHADNLPYEKYLEWLSSVFSECKRVLRTGGRFCINIDAITNREDSIDQKQCYIRDIRTDLAIMMQKIGMMFFGEHIWLKTQWNGKKSAWGSWKSCSSPAVRRSHEYVLVYSKDTFKLEKDNQSDDSDLTAKQFQTYIDSMWGIQPETKDLCSHPAPYPIELPHRCIKLYSYPNDIIIDPYNGTGTTCLAAKINKRRYIGIDNSAKYCEFARNRLNADNNLFE